MNISRKTPLFSLSFPSNNQSENLVIIIIGEVILGKLLFKVKITAFITEVLR